jgi:uncharacterized protein YkwD
MRSWAILVLSALVFALPAAGASLDDPELADPADGQIEIDTASESVSTCWSYRPAERRFMRRHNQARSASSLPRLRRSRPLSRVARRHTNDMVRADDLFHSGDPLRRRVTNWVLLGENVGRGSTVDSLQQAFMNSPAHRANVLHTSFRFMGVGTRRAHGRLYVTVVFSAVRRPGTTLRMPSC